MNTEKLFLKKKFILGLDKPIITFDLDFFITCCHVQEDFTIFSEKQRLFDEIIECSIKYAKKDIYLSPLDITAYFDIDDFIFFEKDIEEIFNFMLKDLLPLFKNKDGYVAKLICDILRTKWREDGDEVFYPKGEFFLRRYFSNESLHKFMTHGTFAHKFTNWLFNQITWDKEPINLTGMVEHLCEVKESKSDTRSSSPSALFKNVNLWKNLRQKNAMDINFSNAEKFSASMDIKKFNWYLWHECI